MNEKNAQGNEFIFAPLRRTELTGDIAGPMASLCLTQVYRYSKEQCDKVLEARYRFPLPGDAAVTGVKVTFGDTEIQTELKDRQTAKDEYKEAKKAGEKAVLVTRESPDVFTICIAGLEPDMDVRIETRYVQLAAPEGIGWSVRIPLTTAPRYVRKDEFSSRHAHGQPLAVLRDPGHRFTIDVKIHGARSVESPTHRLSMDVDGEDLRVRLQEGEVVPDRDCVLIWKPKQEERLPMLRVMAQEDTDETYFLAWLAPPASGDVRKIQGEYIVLVDHSGSMSGPKWEAADWAVEKFLLGLGEDDHFTLGLFHNTTKWFSRSLVRASQDSVKNAVEFLKANKDSGGTELGVALEQALSVKRLGGDIARNVLIITDAEVTDEGRILRLVSEEAVRADHRRISMLCIDASPNSFLASEIAEKGGGIAKFLTSDPKEGDISTALDFILEDWKGPVIAGVRLTADRPGLYSGNRNVLVSPDGQRYIDLGDLTAGRTTWVSGKVSGRIGNGINFEISDGARQRTASLAMTASDSIASLKPLYGARKLLRLEFLIHGRYSGKDLRKDLIALGYDPEIALKSNEKPSLYPENNEVNEMEALKNFIVKESLNYGLPSSETALIAVYHKAGKRVEATALVPNALPSGWSERFESVDLVCMNLPAPAPAGAAKINSAPKSFNYAQQPVMSRRKWSSAEILDDVGPAVDMDTVVFSGMPVIANGEAVLVDTSVNSAKLKGAGTIYRLKVTLSGKQPAIDPNLSILIFVDDMSMPRAKVRLADLIKQRGVRPLNIAISGVVKLVLSDPSGAWAKTAPKMEISLGLR